MVGSRIPFKLWDLGTMRYWTKEQIDGIMSAIEEDRLAVFFGSGISVSGGLPDWDGLRKCLLKTIDNPDLYPKRLKAGIGYVMDRNPEQSLDYLKNLDPQAFEKQFRKIFSKKREQYQTTKEGLILAKIKSNRFITTNYDYCFQNSFNKVNQLSRLSEISCREFNGVKLDQIGSPTIFQIHGSSEMDINELVLTDSQYETAYTEGSPIRELLNHLFSEFLVLFVGFGFNDGDITRILKKYNAYSKQRAKYQHIGIFGHYGNKSQMIGMTDFARRHWNTETVFYKINTRNGKSTHVGIRKLLSELYKSIDDRFVDKVMPSTYISDESQMAIAPLMHVDK